MNRKEEAATLSNSLKLKLAPIAISFTASPPSDIPRVDAPAPSGCTYWKMAAEGGVFWTAPSDHYGCPIGSHTHGVELPAEKAEELHGLIQTMAGLQYLRIEEVEAIPRIQHQFAAAVYAPLSKASDDVDVVLVRGNASQMMLLAEAANAAGLNAKGGVMGRPTCAMVPVVLDSNEYATSLGCIGNRVYTDLGADEFYFAAPGAKLAAVVEKLETIINANAALEQFHRGRRNL